MYGSHTHLASSENSVVAWERSKVQSPFELYVDLLRIITGLRNCKSSCHVRYCVCTLIYSSNRSHRCGESRNLRSADEAQQAGLGTVNIPTLRLSAGSLPSLSSGPHLV